MSQKEIKVEGSGCCGCLLLIFAVIGFVAFLQWLFGFHIVVIR